MAFPLKLEHDSVESGLRGSFCWQGVPMELVDEFGNVQVLEVKHRKCSLNDRQLIVSIGSIVAMVS